MGYTHAYLFKFLFLLDIPAALLLANCKLITYNCTWVFSDQKMYKCCCCQSRWKCTSRL